MESPVVVDKPPEYHGNNERGFPFDEEEGSGAWSELAARHPDIAARLRQRPATWTRKRRPSSQDAADDFGDSFTGFDRFPFDDIPAEFRDHFPSHWNRRHPRDEPPPDASAPPPPSASPHHTSAATQTEQPAEPPPPAPEHALPQYGLRNTVDLGQRSAADPSVVDAEERSPRSMSAPPAPRPLSPAMADRADPSADHHSASNTSTVRHIPIFVEGRDEPVINKSVDHGPHYADTKPQYQPPPPHADRDQYFADEAPPSFHHAPNFTRAFGGPFGRTRQGPQPFTQQKAYPQNAFARGASPQRTQSPKAPVHEEFVKVPVQHEHAPPRTDPPPTRPQPPPQQHQQQHPQPQQQQQQQPQREQTPPKPQPTSNDPITQILSIQTDVLNLMTEVENFKGTKKDKRYLFLDEMLTRNLIKLDNIETEGKENIRLARKEAIRCIQKCIAVLEAKAEGNANMAAAAGAPPHDVEMSENAEPSPAPLDQATENGEVEMKETPTEQAKVDPQPEPQRTDEAQAPPEQNPTEAQQDPAQVVKIEEPKPQVAENVDTQPPAADTRPQESKTEEKPDEKVVDNKPSPKKKIVKKRDKSKDKKEAVKESEIKDASKDSNKAETQESNTVDMIPVDHKGDKVQAMEIDGGASQ